MFGSIVFDFGVIALNFGGGEGGGKGARARPSLGRCARAQRQRALLHKKLECPFF